MGVESKPSSSGEVDSACCSLIAANEESMRLSSTGFAGLVDLSGTPRRKYFAISSSSSLSSSLLLLSSLALLSFRLDIDSSEPELENEMRERLGLASAAVAARRRNGSGRRSDCKTFEAGGACCLFAAIAAKAFFIFSVAESRSGVCSSCLRILSTPCCCLSPGIAALVFALCILFGIAAEFFSAFTVAYSGGSRREVCS
jgi:hypothetical protein